MVHVKTHHSIFGALFPSHLGNQVSNRLLSNPYPVEFHGLLTGKAQRTVPTSLTHDIPILIAVALSLQCSSPASTALIPFRCAELACLRCSESPPFQSFC